MKTFSLALPLLVGLYGCGKNGSDESATPTGTGGTTGCGLDLVGQDLSGALYSVWGSSASDVWTVGADAGGGPLVLHYDGTGWTTVDTGTTGDLWWVWGSGTDDIWFSGAGGRVIHHVPSAGTFDEQVITDASLVLFGMWGSAAGDIWTVGGDVSGGSRGVALRYDGTDWTAVADVPTQATGASIFKVWGASASDVWMVGQNGLLMHTDGAGSWRIDPPPSGPTMGATTGFLTVSGCGTEVTAVGGFNNAAVAHYDGSVWSDASPPPQAIAPALNGIDVDCAHGSIAVGNDGAIYALESEWTPVCGVDTLLGYHGVWIDPDGGIWAVGGDLTAQTSGLLVYKGAAGVPTIP